MESNELSLMIDQLKDSVNVDETKWKPIWDFIKNISSSFKLTQFSSREERETEWKRFQEIVDEVKFLQNESKKKWEEKVLTSEHHRNTVVLLAEAANIKESEVTKDLLKIYSDKIKEGWEYFKENKQAMLRDHKDQAFKSLKKVDEILQASWTEWKSNSIEATEDRTNRITKQIANLEERLEKLNSVLLSKQTNLAKLEAMKENSRTEDFENKVTSWIESDKVDIQDIGVKIENVSAWLAEARSKLD